MSKLSETAYAKVNLALHVREKLSDGFHRIETIFAFCEDGDELSGEPADSVALALSGEFGGAAPRDDNLVTRAAAALAREAAPQRGARLALSKRLPIASGLGGGSADAAATLRLLNLLWELRLPLERLEDIGRTLGADVPACVHSKTMRGEGRGDRLTPLDIKVSGTPILLVNAREEVSTAAVFARWDGFDRGALENWERGRNDLEAAAVSIAPQIGSVLAWLSTQRGATCVRMSGSGGSCFAIFDSSDSRDAAEMAVPREWWRLATRLR